MLDIAAEGRQVHESAGESVQGTSGVRDGS
jgi:hypothetical protein